MAVLIINFLTLTASLLPNNYLAIERTRAGRIFAALSYLSFLLAFISVLVLILLTVIIHQTSSPADLARLAKINTLAFQTSSVLLIYGLYYSLFVANKREVPPDRILMVNGVTLGPGTRFSLYEPWCRYQVEVLRNKINIDFSELNLSFIDGEFTLDLSTKVQLDFSGVQLLGDIHAIQKKAREWIESLVTAEAAKTTLGDFLKKDSLVHNTVIEGIPVRWAEDDEAEVELVAW